MQQMLAVRSPMAAILSRSWRRKFTLRSFSSEKNNSPPNRSRGGIPRFHSPFLPSSKGEVVRVEGDEFWHMAKVLRLGPNDRVELFNGAGGIVEGCIQRVDQAGTDVMALEDPKQNAPQGIQWHVFAAFGTLKGGRADWLIEKCTELGASSVTPLLTERSPTMADNRVDRLHRVILAATKQCQRLHGMTLNPPMKFHDFLPIVARSKFCLLAAAGSTSLINILSSLSIAAEGVIIVGPEGGRAALSSLIQLFMKVSDRMTLMAQHSSKTHSRGVTCNLEHSREVGPLQRRHMQSRTLSRSQVGKVPDFTEKEVELIAKAGVISVGLGPSRLRVETATIALLATVMLWTDVQKLDP